MNTPAHAVASLLLWREEKEPWNVVALVSGAFLPDLTMFAFFAYKRTVGVDISVIFEKHYFLPHWQLIFDLFNSIPIYLVLAALCFFLKFRFGYLLFASSLLHCLCDFPLHNDDAHRHFLPFTDWRFESPLSYWDPKYGGRIVSVLELLFALGGSVWLVAKKYSKSIRIAAGGILLIYGLFIGLFLVFLFLKSQ